MHSLYLWLRLRTEPKLCKRSSRKRGMRTIHVIAIAGLLFVATATFAQGSPARARAVAAFDEGVQHLLEGKAARAARSLRKSVRFDSTFIPGLRMLGVACDLQDDYRCALEAYRSVLRRAPHFSRLLYYHTGDVYLRSGQPQLALPYFLKFRELQEEDVGNYGLMGEQEYPAEQEVVAHKLEQRILSARISADSSNYVNASGLYNLGRPINSEQNDYFPFFTNDLNGLLYTRQGADGDEDLLEGERRGPAADYRTTRFSNFNTGQPEGMCTLVRDGETIYFTLCYENAEGGGCDIHAGILAGGKIRDVERLPAYLNSSTWDSQAAISCDGRQLFFASTRPGGIGGSDLYRSERLADGSWSDPVNLGDGVNTPADEEAPFLSNDGETLYFSSMGHQGLGDQDIFFSRWDAQWKRWSPAVNIGPPINSPNRELGFHLSADGKQGFFASDRQGGEGGLDIYGFTLSEKLTGKDVTYVSGYVTDSLSGTPIPDQEVAVAGGSVFRTNYAGRFFICAPPDAALPLTVDHAAYLPYRRSFAIPAWDNRSTYRIDLQLATRQARTPPPAPAPPPEPVARRERTEKVRVLFAFEQSTLSAQTREALRKFMAATGPGSIRSVTVLGYTDEVGGSAFNLRLSTARAEAVSVYLQELGVPSEKIRQEGRGEVAGPDDRQQKRRVEVIVRLR